jgi:hypothetical protein
MFGNVAGIGTSLALSGGLKQPMSTLPGAANFQSEDVSQAGIPSNNGTPWSLLR